MERRKVFAVIGLAATTFALYRATRRIGRSAMELHRRGPRLDVLIPGAIAIIAFLAAAERFGGSLQKARRAL